MSYRVKKISMADIEKFESIRLWRFFLSFRTILSVRYRFYVYRPSPWKRVLLLRLTNGKCFLLDCGLTEPILKGLNQCLLQQQPSITPQERGVAQCVNLFVSLFFIFLRSQIDNQQLLLYELRTLRNYEKIMEFSK